MKKLSSSQITSIDENGNRVYLQPAEVTGPYRTWRTRVQVILMLIFLLVPWTTMNGQQTILLDISQREFYIFGTLFRAHNAPLMFFLVLGGAITLAFVTSVWGRVWCGWACPQTVFIDGVFRQIEIWIEGNYLARRKMQTDPLSLNWIFKKSLKWFLFLIVSSFIAHSFLAYFVGARQFHLIIENGPSHNMTVFVIVQFFTLLFLFDFGWFREQFCTIMCPYGRIQGLLMDKSSLAVVYDEERKDCVSCNRCVSACPIGIDIRNGLQMECIACTACIDACDEIMEKVHKPKGLIRYDTLDRSSIKLTKPRSLLYIFIILVCILGLTYNLSTKTHSEAFFLRAKDDPFKIIQEERNQVEVPFVLNHFRFHVTNQDFKDHRYRIEVIEPRSLEFVTAEKEITLKSKDFKEWHVFLKIPQSDFKPHLRAKISIIDAEDEKLFNKKFDVEMIGPAQ